MIYYISKVKKANSLPARAYVLPLMRIALVTKKAFN